MTIEQTVDIAADGRLRLDMALPETVSGGKASVVVVFPAAESPAPESLAAESPNAREPFPTLEELKADAALKHAKRMETGIDPLARFAGCLKDVFTEDGVEYQRKLRDEWPD